MHLTEKRILVFTGLVGLFGAVLTGVGEFLLHFDTLARFSAGAYDFMRGMSSDQQTIGHFFGVLGAPLYVVGMWHIYLMLKPAHQKLAFVTFLVSAYGFMIGADWISSRASIGAIIHFQETGADIGNLIDLYQVRYESLLTIIRVTTLFLSFVFIGLTLTGRSRYQKWHAFFNPIFLLILSFVVYFVTPSIGKYMMPIALNIGFGVFFILSLIQSRKL